MTVRASCKIIQNNEGHLQQNIICVGMYGQTLPNCVLCTQCGPASTNTRPLYELGNTVVYIINHPALGVQCVRGWLCWLAAAIALWLCGCCYYTNNNNYYY